MPVSVATLRKVLRMPNPVAMLRAMVAVHHRQGPAPQFSFWVEDAEGLPPRPWRIYRDTPIDCVTLHCRIPAHVCVARQVASDLQRTTDRERGTVPDYPSCMTERCAQGRGIRGALDPLVSISWRGAGPNGRFERGRSGAEAQRRARQRAAATGLLDPVPTCDGEDEEG